MIDSGTDPTVIKDIINTERFVEIIKNPVVSKAFLKINRLCNRYQILLNEERLILDAFHKKVKLKKKLLMMLE